MNPMLLRIFAGAALVAAVVGGALYVRTLHAENALLADRLDRAKHDIDARDRTITGLTRNAAEKGRQQKQLDKSTAQVEGAVSTIRQQIRKAVSENAIAHDWANTPLPPDVIRLSASPARTGATDFGAGVPAPDAVHPAGAGAAH